MQQFHLSKIANKQINERRICQEIAVRYFWGLKSQFIVREKMLASKVD